MEQFKPVFLEEVVGDRFGRYSKYIIQDRAIPDVRDGLKPVQRRILYAMYEAGNTADKPYRKAAKTVGDVMGNYHPHGDSSIYEGMVRMAQPWKMGHPLIDGHGNWGSLDDDPAAAMRYTEARLSPIALELMRDIEKGTVPFKDNFDNSIQEPSVLPARFPNLLVNGVSGISAGFATEIPTHNLREVIDASIALLEKPDITLDELMNYVQGPDFPTGGIVMGEKGIRDAYETGKGRIFIRAKTEIEDLRGGKKQIVITEIPYQVVKSKLVTAMENIRLERKVEGITEVRDESGRDGLRIVVELKKDADAEGIFNYLLKRTDLQTTYHFNMVAIVNQTPKQLGLKPLLEAYINHQKEVVTKRTQHDLAKAEDRSHVVAGLVKALSILDEVIETIKASNNRQDAAKNLIARFGFTERQAESILALQLYRLTNLEITSLEKERAELLKQIEIYNEILNKPAKLNAVIKKELRAIQKVHGISRRSEIQSKVEDIKVNLEVLVAPEDVWVTLSHEGYIKRTNLLSFQRSGADLESTGLKDGDRLRYGFEINTLDQLLIFTDDGKYFALPVHQIPEFKWKDIGTALVNVLPISKEDEIVQVIPIKTFKEANQSLLFITQGGQVKRTMLEEYETNRTMAIVACRLQEGDRLLQVIPSTGEDDVLLITKQGMSIRFSEINVKAMGRNSIGVRGIQLNDGDECIGAMLIHPEDDGELFVLTDKGYGKKTKLTEFATQNRGGKGIQTIEFKTGKRVRSNGTFLVFSQAPVHPANSWDILKQNGEHVIITAKDISLEERRSTGKLLVSVKKDESIELVTLRPSVANEND